VVFTPKENGDVAAGELSGSLKPSTTIRSVSESMSIGLDCKFNLGKVHYQLAVLHGMGRFPVVEEENAQPLANHDAFSVLFHLSHAASFNSVAACLALGRLRSGLGTCVSPLLDEITPIDFDLAKDLLRRAMESPYPPIEPKAAAGCLLYQIYVDEKESDGDDVDDEKKSADRPSDATLTQLLQDILQLLYESQREQEELKAHSDVARTSTAIGFQVGDRVNGNCLLEGTFYPGAIESVSDNGRDIVVRYDDDGSTETLTKENVRSRVPYSATQTALGGPLSDEEALGTENSDENCVIEVYELQADLAELKEKAGFREYAAILYEDASKEAMAANKMQKANNWSMKAAEMLS